jgi:hypothetical protein
VYGKTETTSETTWFFQLPKGAVRNVIMRVMAPTYELLELQLVGGGRLTYKLVENQYTVQSILPVKAECNCFLFFLYLTMLALSLQTNIQSQKATIMHFMAGTG